MFEEQFFRLRKPDRGRLFSYGFAEEADGYRKQAVVMDGQFRLEIFIPRRGAVSTRMFDRVTGEEYALYKVPSSAGPFVGEVRNACETILKEIADQCFTPDVFHGEQTAEVVEYVRARYGDEREFLWEKFPDNAVWRRKDNQKWYGVVLTVSRKKLGFDSDEVAEILDLRLSPDRMEDTVDHEKYFPGWHMNKKSWYTVVLDGSVPTAELCRRIDGSYRLAVR